jgi:hypothetical protein
MIVGAQHSMGYYRKFVERERVSAQLELRATQHVRFAWVDPAGPMLFD